MHATAVMPSPLRIETLHSILNLASRTKPSSTELQRWGRRGTRRTMHKRTKRRISAATRRNHILHTTTTTRKGKHADPRELQFETSTGREQRIERMQGTEILIVHLPTQPSLLHKAPANFFIPSLAPIICTTEDIIRIKKASIFENIHRPRLR